MYDVVSQEITDTALGAINPAMRMQCHKGEFFPIVEGVLVVVDVDGSIRGARVYFEPPVKPAWVNPRREASMAGYDTAREQQSPLICTYYLFGGVNLAECKEAIIYTNSTET